MAHPIRRPVTRYLEYTGTTEAFESVDLRARVPGFLDQVSFKPGAAVKKGDLLFVIDPRVGIGIEWTALSFQERRAAGTGGLVFGLALVVVYLILAALYESWSIPLAVIISIPLAVLGPMLGLMFRGMDNNTYTQIGLVLPVGLGAKNAILIVELRLAEPSGN